MLIDVLRGRTTDKLSNAKLDLLPAFGKLNNVSRDELYIIIDWLIMNHFILRTKGQYPVLHSTYDGMHYDEKMTEEQLKRLKKYLEMSS